MKTEALVKHIDRAAKILIEANDQLLLVPGLERERRAIISVRQKILIAALAMEANENEAAETKEETK